MVLRARDAADDVLKAARDTADGKGDNSCTPAVMDERALADDAVEAERSDADESIRRERAERRRALASLLRLEREQTDQHLLTERGFSDDALNTRDIFLAMVSHDLRTMLGGIAMNAELLAREAMVAGDSKPTLRSRTETIQRLTARMNRLIGDLVDVASIEAGKLLVAPTEGDLRALIHESVEIFQTLRRCARDPARGRHRAIAAARQIRFRAPAPGRRQPAQQRDQVLTARRYPSPSGQSEQAARSASRSPTPDVESLRRASRRSSASSGRSAVAIARASAWASTSRGASWKRTAARIWAESRCPRAARSSSRSRRPEIAGGPDRRASVAPVYRRVQIAFEQHAQRVGRAALRRRRAGPMPLTGVENRSCSG